MSIRKMAGLVAALGCLLVVGVGSASASTRVTLDNPSGPFSGVTTITNTSSHPATLKVVNPDGHITCLNTTFEATLHSHFSAGSITGTLNTLTFQNCTDTLPVIAISECRLVPVTGTSAAVSVTATGANTSTQNVADARVFCAVAGSTSGCYYTAATATGNGTNVPSALAFSNISVSRATAGVTNDLGAACGTSGTFDVRLTHIVQVGTNRTVTIEP